MGSQHSKIDMLTTCLFVLNCSTADPWRLQLKDEWEEQHAAVIQDHQQQQAALAEHKAAAAAAAKERALAAAKQAAAAEAVAVMPSTGPAGSVPTAVLHAFPLPFQQELPAPLQAAGQPGVLPVNFMQQLMSMRAAAGGMMSRQA